MNCAVLQFPGSNCDQDCVHVLRDVLGQPTRLVWHKDNSLQDAELVIVPGGFSYGDYLRGGAIARFSPIMQAVRSFADQGGLVLGICNGFQILCESGLLPGALIRNRSLQFRCEHVFLTSDRTDSAFTCRQPRSSVMRIPIAHGEGCYFVDEATRTLMEAKGQVLWRYTDVHAQPTTEANPNGSVGNIAGVCNEAGNVAGLMPHPERACEALLGSSDGLWIFESLLHPDAIAEPAIPDRQSA